MISENDIGMNKEIASSEEEKPTIEKTLSIHYTNDEEQKPVVTSSEEESATLKEEDEEEHNDQSKSETEMDTQPLFEQSIIVEGKRSRRPVVRLEASDLTPSKKILSIPHGHGKPLGEIEYINYKISHASPDDLSRLHRICFGRRGNKTNIRKHLREFKGFEFESDTDEYKKHLNVLTKLKKAQLRSASNILGLVLTGRNPDQAKRILDFLIKPVDEGKRLPGKKIVKRNPKKRSTNSKESVDSDQKKVENSGDEHGSDYVFKPGKKTSNKRSANHENSTDIKRRKGDSTESEEPKENEAPVESTDNNQMEKTEQNEAIANDKVEEVV